MVSSANQIRTYTGPAVLSYGFRPFFLAGAGWSALAMALWIPFVAGHAVLPTAMAPVDWHVHEMLFGFVPAIMAGFLLTAIPNWTGRLPVVGRPLAALVSVWIAGRIAVACSAILSAPLSALVDLAFLATLAWVVAREIIAGRNHRNLTVLAAIVALWLADLAFHLEAQGHLTGGLGQRLGIATTVALIMLIGGRIIPSFTRNWLARRGPGRLPTPFGTFDVTVMVFSLLCLMSWVASQDQSITAISASVAAAANFARLWRWAGERTTAEPMVLVLHVAYLFLPVGFALLAASLLFPIAVPKSAFVHAWTGGAIGLMALAVMTRASLGHTGQPLTATPAIRAVYVTVGVGAVLRIGAALGVGPDALLQLAGLAWIGGFAGFVFLYSRLLTTSRR